MTSIDVATIGLGYGNKGLNIEICLCRDVFETSVPETPVLY